ncbi:MAG: aldo/keto reductase [Deltaproteobacteria bacterium]|nr:aldo/keto reductase [Deltaproteobacteria bacterium]
MRTKPFGWTGVEVAVIGQGTWKMGGSRRAHGSEVEALRAGLELGMTHLDTAEMYGDGGAESLLAELLRGRRRDQVFLTSKVLPQHASRRGTITACEHSLRRLGTDHLDLYLLHWAGPHPIGDTMQAMEELVAAGKTRFIGVSNFEVDELREAMAALTRERLACNQVLYNLTERGIEADLIPFCARAGIAVVGYTPYGGWPRRGAGLRVLERIGAAQGRSARQVALAFLTRQPEVFAIPKAADAVHARDNAGAADVVLAAADIAAIDAAFPAPPAGAPLATA